jgi:mannose-6-phosphate isomerase
MLYPFKFEPIYKEVVWGGDRLKTHFNRKIPGVSIGESWDVVCHN